MPKKGRKSKAIVKKPNNKPAKSHHDDEVAGLLFVGAILIFGFLGLMFWGTGLGFALGVGIGFILMGLAKMKCR
jgi:hypothetical protein